MLKAGRPTICYKASTRKTPTVEIPAHLDPSSVHIETFIGVLAAKAGLISPLL